MGEQISCDLLVAYNQSSLAFSLDFGDGTTQSFSFTSNNLNNISKIVVIKFNIN